MLEYLSQIEGKGILTGQHTQTMEQPEIWRIEKLTGKLPAICGFELLSYSPNIRRETADEECLKEVDENTGTLEKAWEWAERGGLMTFTWHWFSPLGGNDKSFYAEKTDYDAAKAVMEGTPEHEALCHDLDHMAGVLRPSYPDSVASFPRIRGRMVLVGSKGTGSGGRTVPLYVPLLYTASSSG